MSSTDDPGPQPGPPPSKPPVHHTRVGGRIRNYFLTGLVVAGPLAITVWLTWSFITWVDDVVRPFVPVDYRPETYLPRQIPGTSLYLPGRLPGTGLTIAFVALTLPGFLTANRAPPQLVAPPDRLLPHLPLA